MTTSTDTSAKLHTTGTIQQLALRVNGVEYTLNVDPPSHWWTKATPGPSKRSASG